jgi:hypothetical protein
MIAAPSNVFVTDFAAMSDTKVKRKANNIPEHKNHLLKICNLEDEK